MCSCKENDIRREENSYEIISVLYNRMAVPIPAPFPPLKEGITETDSLKIIHTVENIRKKQENRKYIVAVDPFLIPVDNIEINTQELNPELKSLFSMLTSINGKRRLDILKIRGERNDSIIAYNDSLTKGKCDFINFDSRINFSRIAFNENLTSAAVIGSASTSCVAGDASLYFLEKKNGYWEVIKVILLSVA